MNKKREDRQVYCVYLEKLGRLPAGIYQRHVKIIDDMAIVLPESGRTAHILPAANIFEKKQDAEQYLGGLGVPHWVVTSASRRDIPEMFYGRIITYSHERYGGIRHRSTLVMRSDGTTLVGDYNTRYYTNKKKAESDYAHRWREKFKDTKKDMVANSELLTKLMECKPRSKRKPLLLQGETAILKATGGA
jgi:hypothetical protein